MLFAGALASQEANQDPIDLAFLAAAKAHHVFDGVPAVIPISFAPFDAKNRRTEAVVEQNGQRLRVMKGAVRTVAEACGLQPPAIEALEARVSESALERISDARRGQRPRVRHARTGRIGDACTIRPGRMPSNSSPSCAIWVSL